eukprot:1158454-Pelagomonas_calceolata.AAC.18
MVTTTTAVVRVQKRGTLTVCLKDFTVQSNAETSLAILVLIRPFAMLRNLACMLPVANACSKQGLHP